jgi:hypothetical protein
VQWKAINFGLPDFPEKPFQSTNSVVLHLEYQASQFIKLYGKPIFTVQQIEAQLLQDKY